MKKVMLLMLVVIAASAVAMAQIRPPTSDVLGAHLNYGRGCAACHAPHSGAWGNGANKSGDTTAGNIAFCGARTWVTCSARRSQPAAPIGTKLKLPKSCLPAFWLARLT